MRSFLPLIREGTAKKIMLLSSGLGSLQNAPYLPGYCESYSVSKAALNMLARKWGASLSKERITTILVHPGWVDTDMGNSTKEWMAERFPQIKQISRSASATGCLQVLTHAKPRTQWATTLGMARDCLGDVIVELLMFTVARSNSKRYSKTCQLWLLNMNTGTPGAECYSISSSKLDYQVSDHGKQGTLFTPTVCRG
ncbi:uncharacterized protein B0H18DRAFT_218413 [Fomitopsis serialis]|uniref:uncharacterized protein n=1 Tax=Fomitopsis serialis TaxID=139415 RepID=UPI00200890D9|nr:uncharacterized protein B0H18DRAFT_218413 [Neoantrodia serialis]KAH9913014.1 hypothetical protein B0H18DRAFT_218413 [Neoantrodia serialis]